jgi:hypothetical protein
VIATLVAGGVAWILFGLWEWKFAQKPIVPITNWESKNPIWGVLTIATVKIINSLMDLQYFLTYLQVTRRVTPRVATYLERGFNCAYVCLPVLIGYCMTKTHNWRPYVWAGSGLCVLATGLMIPARHSTFSDAFIVIVQVLFGSADALMHYPMMVAVQASVPPEGNYTLEYACLLNRENEN